MVLQRTAALSPQGFIVPDPDRVSILGITLKRQLRNRSWKAALMAAGDLDPRSYGLESPYEEVQAPWLHAKEVELYLVNFGRFRSSERVEEYAKRSGYRVAPPRAALAIAEAVPDLPERLDLPRPLSIASLAPCYREEGEMFVTSISWTRRAERAIRGVYYRYGWEPEYWFVFEDMPHVAANH